MSQPPTRRTNLKTYYEEAGMDYGAWSRSYNMHFGYYRWPMNPFDRESMLEELSTQVFERLNLQSNDQVFDLGCGLGAPTRHLARSYPVSVTGFTIVPWQVEQAIRLTEPTDRWNIHYELGDYTNLARPDASADALYSIEASCHDRGPAKAAFIAEASRLLRPGGRLVVADGFTKGTTGAPMWWKKALGVVTDYWALECFADISEFQAALEQNGLVLVETKEISWRIAPSVFHIPWVTFRFLIRELVLKRHHLNRVRWGHIYACVCSPLVGILRSRFGYYLVTAEKPE